MIRKLHYIVGFLESKPAIKANICHFSIAEQLKQSVGYAVFQYFTRQSAICLVRRIGYIEQY